MITTNQFKNGTHIEVDGTIYRIVEFQHVKPGKGGAFVRTKLRKLDDGSVQDKTFRAGEKFRPVRTETRRMQYLYDSGDAAVFMDNADYSAARDPAAVAGEAMQWVLPNSEVEVLFVDERPAGVQVPSAVEMAVTETQPGVKGDTASGGGTKPATLESGVRWTCRCSSTRATGSGSTPAAASTSRGHEAAATGISRMRRSDQRRAAVFALYQREVTGRPQPRRLDDAKPFTRELVEGVEEHRARARRRDRRGLRAGGSWSGSRRSRRASCGSRCTSSATATTCPTEVAIDEAVALAKRYCGADAPGFVNGILGSAARAESA